MDNVLNRLATLTGYTIQQIRSNNNLTQQQLADRWKVDRVTVARWERCSHPIDFRLSTVLNIISNELDDVTNLINSEQMLAADDITDYIINYLDFKQLDGNLAQLLETYLNDYKNNMVKAINHYKSIGKHETSHAKYY